MIIRRISKSKIGMIAFVIFISWLIVAIFQPFLRPYSPTAYHIADRFSSPSLQYPFGTDRYGRDVFSRVLAGSTTVFLIASAATSIGLILGTAIGVSAGYFGGSIDELLMRFVDILMSFPDLLFAMLIISMFGPSLFGVVFVIGLVFTPRVARLVRSAALDLRHKGFVEAAQVRGESSFYIMAGEIFPNVLGPLGVEGAVRFGYAIFMSASLGFLGLGVQPPTPDWGLMMSEAKKYLTVAPWMVIFPALAIASIIVSVNILGDIIRQLENGDL